MDKDKQMSFLFEEGGMADDGLDRDPVSGNEVPSGSMSEEVRDDIPAQLSEGEYVVPADVVRYYGVRFFEELRDDAKEGLTGMEREGRIGGEPVDMEGDDTELTADEMAELDAIMGMAVGGMVQNSYDNPPPEAIGNTMMEPRGYQEGGFVNPDFSRFGAGYSFMGSDVTQVMPSTQAVQQVTLYGPGGEVVNLTLPAQQSQYDLLLSQGYSTTPPTQVAPVQAPQVQPVQQDSGDDGISEAEFGRALSGYQTGSYDEDGRFNAGVSYLSNSQLNLLETDPLAYGRTEMSENFRLGRGIAAGVGALAPGLGLIAGIGMANAEATALNRSEAALERARAMGTYTPAELAEYEAELEAARKNAGFLARQFPGSGDRQRRELESVMQRRAEIRDWNNNPEGLGPATGGAMQDARAEYLAATYGTVGGAGSAAAEYTANQLKSGYTGAGVGGIAMGNIAGDGQVEGVVARMEVRNGKEVPVVVRNSEGKTIYRDEQGRAYVRAGAFTRKRDYLEEEELPPEVPAPTNAPEPTESDESADQASVICTALFNKGLLSKEIFMLDTQYGIMLESSQPEVTHGYRKLATPLANYIQEDTLGATVARTLVAPLAKAWANEMAHQMQPENYKGNLLGKAIIKLGYPVCAFVGKRSKEIVYGT